MTLLFIPSLMEGNIDGFLTKTAIVVLIWLIPMIASIVDLITGIAASKRTGVQHTTSWGIRRTLRKDLQYLALLFMLLLIDICLSALSPYMSFFVAPILSFLGTTAITIIEFISVMENTRKGVSPEEDKIDDIQQLAHQLVDSLGTEKAKAIMLAMQNYYENKKA